MPHFEVLGEGLVGCILLTTNAAYLLPLLDNLLV